MLVGGTRGSRGSRENTFRLQNAGIIFALSASDSMNMNGNMKLAWIIIHLEAQKD